MNKSYVIWDNERHGWLEATSVDWIQRKCTVRATDDLGEATKFSFDEIVKLSLYTTTGRTVFEA